MHLLPAYRFLLNRDDTFWRYIFNKGKSGHRKENYKIFFFFFELSKCIDRCRKFRFLSSYDDTKWYERFFFFFFYDTILCNKRRERHK